MWEAMARRIEAGGGEILLDAPVDRLDVEHGRVVSIDAAGRTYRPDAVISSLPLRDVVAMTRPQPPAEVVDAARGPRLPRLPHRRARSSRATTSFPDNWIYIHDPSVRVGRIQNYRSWSPWMVPDPREGVRRARVLLLRRRRTSVR
jgi:protoporphyrinogen oxidase